MFSQNLKFICLDLCLLIPREQRRVPYQFLQKTEEFSLVNFLAGEHVILHSASFQLYCRNCKYWVKMQNSLLFLINSHHNQSHYKYFKVIFLGSNKESPFCVFIFFISVTITHTTVKEILKEELSTLIIDFYMFLFLFIYRFFKTDFLILVILWFWIYSCFRTISSITIFFCHLISMQ